MELKKKEDQSVDSSILHRMENKTITGGRVEEEPGKEKGGRTEGHMWLQYHCKQLVLRSGEFQRSASRLNKGDTPWQSAAIPEI